MLLPARLLLRRAYDVEVIGRVLELSALGVSVRRIAARATVARSTVRGWVDRLRRRAAMLVGHFTGWLLWLTPSTSRVQPAGGPVADVLAVITACGTVAVAQLAMASVWQFAAAATGGRLLCNTSSPFPAPWNV